MRRVAVTGMGIVSSIGATVADVRTALRDGRSGIVASPVYADMGFRCQVHAPPLIEDPVVTRRIDQLAAPGGPLHGII